MEKVWNIKINEYEFFFKNKEVVQTIKAVIENIY